MFARPKLKIKKKFLKIIILGFVFVIIIFVALHFLKDKGLIFEEKKKWQPPTGLPATPKGRVGPSAEFLEKLKEKTKTPAGTEFRGPTSPPPGQ